MKKYCHFKGSKTIGTHKNNSSNTNNKISIAPKSGTKTCNQNRFFKEFSNKQRDKTK